MAVELKSNRSCNRRITSKAITDIKFGNCKLMETEMSHFETGSVTPGHQAFGCNSGQVVHTRASVIKQHNLVPT